MGERYVSLGSPARAPLRHSLDVSFFSLVTFSLIINGLLASMGNRREGRAEVCKISDQKELTHHCWNVNLRFLTLTLSRSLSVTTLDPLTQQHPGARECMCDVAVAQ